MRLHISYPIFSYKIVKNIMNKIIGKMLVNISSYMLILAIGFLSFTVLPSSTIAKDTALPDDWRTMSDWYWVKFVDEGITAEQMQFMIDNGLDANKMLTPDVNRGPKQYSLLYAIIGNKNPIALVKILLDAGADTNLTNKEATNLPLDRAIASYKFDVALLLIEHDAVGVEENKQTLFDEVFQELIKYGYGEHFHRDIDLAQAILTLNYLIAQGVHPNTKVLDYNGDISHYVTPIFYTLAACINDGYMSDADGRNLYLKIIKLLVNEKTDWSAKNIHDSYYHGEGTTTIADTLEWIEESARNQECLEALDYVKTHLKENNITLEE